MATTTDGYTWIEREVTRKGKTHKQWFRTKAKAGAATPPASAPPVESVSSVKKQIAAAKAQAKKEWDAKHAASSNPTPKTPSSESAGWKPDGSGGYVHGSGAKLTKQGKKWK